LKGKGDLNGAISEFHTALRLEPHSPTAHTNLGGTLHEKGDLEGAEAEFRTALQLQPDSPSAHNGLANALQASGDVGGAVAEFRRAVGLRPDFAMFRCNLASALADKGDLDGAIAEFRTALRIQPDYALAHANLGTALADTGDLDGAIREYRAALGLDPDNPNAHNYLGIGLSDKGDLDGAIAEFRTAIRLQPDFADAKRNLAVALQKKAERKAAINETRPAQKSAAPHCEQNSRNSPEEVAETAAIRVAEVFSSARFTDIFKEDTLAGGWTFDDALAVWYSLGHLALVIAAWQACKEEKRVFRITNRCRSVLVRQWSMSENVLAKLRGTVNETEAAAVASFTTCKNGADLLLFFSRYVSTILGAPVPFSDRSMFDDQMMGIKYLGADPVLHATVCDLFVGACTSAKQLFEESSIDWDSSIPNELQSVDPSIGPSEFGKVMGRELVKKGVTLGNILFLGHGTRPTASDVHVCEDSEQMKSEGFQLYCTDPLHAPPLDNQSEVLKHTRAAGIGLAAYWAMIAVDFFKREASREAFIRSNGQTMRAELDKLNLGVTIDLVLHYNKAPIIAGLTKRAVLNMKKPGTDDILAALLEEANTQIRRGSLAFQRTGVLGFGQIAVSLVEEIAAQMLQAGKKFGW
jgi:Flp pilus assembly protein TadD